MLTKTPDAPLDFPFPKAPGSGEIIDVAPGILWARLKLPFRLNHVNIYLLEDGDGLAVLDTGIGDDASRAAWEELLAGPLKSRPLTQLIVTHYHPDHVGLAGWLTERFGLPLAMSEQEYDMAAELGHESRVIDVDDNRRFYREHGLDADTTEVVATRGLDYLRRVTDVPSAYRRLTAGETLRVGTRELEIFTGGGHSIEQVMLYSRRDNVFLAADQVLARISPNVSVFNGQREPDPLGRYLESLDEIKASIPADALVLPGHQLPFYGLHTRASELQAHHEHRCGLIADAAREVPRSTAELVPVVFHIPFDPHQLSFAFGEVLAHVNYMLVQERLRLIVGDDGVRRVIASGNR